MDFSSVQEYRMALDRAIDDAMTTTITSKAQEIIQKSMDEHVYSYTPRYTGRPGTVRSPRKDAGGLRSKTYLTPNYFPGIKQLIIEANAPWQNVGYWRTTGDGTGGMELSDAIEEWDMYNAGARPFMKFAEEEAQKELPKKLKSALVQRGL